MTLASYNRGRWEDLEAAVRKLRHDVMVFEMQSEIAHQPNPEIIVAGIEGRAIVRAGMQRELRFIGER